MTSNNRIGIDTGGTFSDFIWLDDQGHLRIHKQRSHPADPSQPIVDGLRVSGAPEDWDIVHGTTVATNALLEGRGARTALITTAGFTDVLVIGRQNRSELYALVPQKQQPLVPDGRRLGLDERISAQGDILIPLDPAQVETIACQLAADAVESVAVCLLFSFLVPDHEQQVAAIIRQVIPDATPQISLSSDILPEYREYERTAVTVINAYVAPLMRRYLARLSDDLTPRRLTIMQSNGGVIDVNTAGAQAVRTVLSGPAGGVVGARFVAASSGEGSGFEDIITFDMGGTSTDVALCPGNIPVTTDGEIGGLPLRIPMIDIHTVGAGGGSLAYIDAGGALYVGPQSAGALPGPACYYARYDDWRQCLDHHFKPGLATVSDANLVLGRLDRDHFLSGHMDLYPESAHQALSALAALIGSSSPEAAAWDVVRIANANMERAIRRISVERGLDPRRFTLVAFGGGGPLHACELAEKMQIPRVLIPTVPGVLSALGMLVAQPSRDYSQTVMLPASDDRTARRLAQQFRLLEARALSDWTIERDSRFDRVFRYSMDIRYQGQSHELAVSFQPGQEMVDLKSAFHATHQARYGYARPEAELEIVTIRLTALTPGEAIRLPQAMPVEEQKDPPPIGEKQVWFEDRFLTAALFSRENLKPGQRLRGPAIIFQYDTTSVIPPAWQGTVDHSLNIVVSRI